MVFTVMITPLGYHCKINSYQIILKKLDSLPEYKEDPSESVPVMFLYDTVLMCPTGRPFYPAGKMLYKLSLV